MKLTDNDYWRCTECASRHLYKSIQFKYTNISLCEKHINKLLEILIEHRDAKVMDGPADSQHT